MFHFQLRGQYICPCCHFITQASSVLFLNSSFGYMFDVCLCFTVFSLFDEFFYMLAAGYGTAPALSLYSYLGFEIIAI